MAEEKYNKEKLKEQKEILILFSEYHEIGFKGHRCNYPSLSDYDRSGDRFGRHPADYEYK